MNEQEGLGRVSGVGGTNFIKHKAIVPIGVAELGNVKYSRSMLENSEVPALLGLRTIDGKNGVIDP
eukprot:11098740-Prorocentrum_lima.AAC.1